MPTKKSTSYQDAGVSIDQGNQFVDKIKSLIKQTHRPEVLSALGGYAGLFGLDLSRFPNPVLVSSTDGVGTKLKLAFDMKIYDTVGQDLVAMCVNDLVCCGAEPLFFLDYFATGKLSPEVGYEVVKGISASLASINCTLLGGETAEMPSMYSDGEFDLAGFVVGAVNKEAMIDGSQISQGDVLIGLESSGFHSNGFSLVRKVLDDNGIDIQKDTCGLDKPIGEILLTPTKLYVNETLALAAQNKLKGLAHITGGGLIENVPRILPHDLAAQFDPSQMKPPAVFNIIQEMGNIEPDEMKRVFNMGIGMVLVVAAKDEKAVLDEMAIQNMPARRIGQMVARPADSNGVIFV